MKNFLINSILFLLLFSCAPDERCLAEKGVLDIRGKEGPVFSLDGEWEFYWNSFYSPEDFSSEKSPIPHYIQVPGYWNSFVDENKAFGPHGYASYRLRILHSFVQENLAIQIPSIVSSCEVWINKQRVFQRGQISDSPEWARHYEQPGIAQFQDTTGVLEIIVLASNFSDIIGGFSLPMHIGPAEMMVRNQQLRLIFQAILFGVLAFFGFSHLGIFSFRKKEKELLFFGIFCLIVSVRLLVRGEVLLFFVLPEMAMEVLRKIEFFTVILAHLSLMFYLKIILKQRFSQLVLYTLVGIGFLYGFLVLFFPLAFYARFLLIYQLIILLSAVYCLVLFLIPRKPKIPLFWIYFGCLFILLVTFIIEAYFIELAIPWGEYFFSYGLIFFIIGQSTIIAMRYSQNFEEITVLSNRLYEYNVNLEKKIKERTHQLEESEKQKTIFFIKIAHETRTPLTLMKVYLENYMQEYGMSPKLKIISDNLNRLQNIIEDFMYLVDGRPSDSEKLSEVIDCQLFLNDKLEQFQALALMKKQSLVGELQKGLFIRVDPKGLDKIINNLLVNAFKYTFEKGNIFLSLKGTEKEILIQVKDDGPGIPFEDQENIFKDFFQLHGTLGSGDGMGMGLSIVKKLAEEMGGKVEVESAPGEGTLFRVIIPRYYPVTDEKALSDYEYENPASNESVIDLPEMVFQPDKETLLIVEDYRALVKILIEELSHLYNIAYALNGLEALELLTVIPKPHLIISDIMMDKMDGIEFYKKLQDFRNADDIPFIFLTAKSGEEDKIAGIERGAVDYITKPFSMEELKKKIASILNVQKNLARNMERHYKQQILDFLNGTQKAKPEAVNDIKLNEREEKIARLLTKGMQYKLIARQLGLSQSLVKKIVHRIYKNFKVTSCMEFIRVFTGTKS